MNITFGVASSVAVAFVVIVIIAIIKGWAKPGSLFLGGILGVLLGATFIGDQVTRWMNANTASGTDWLHRLAKTVHVGNFHPGTTIPSDGWRLIFFALLVVLVIIPAVTALDGSSKKGNKKSKKSSGQ